MTKILYSSPNPLTPRTGDISPKRVGVMKGGLFQRRVVIIHANITLQVRRDSGNITFDGVRSDTQSSTFHINQIVLESNFEAYLAENKQHIN